MNTPTRSYTTTDDLTATAELEASFGGVLDGNPVERGDGNRRQEEHPATLGNVASLPVSTIAGK